MNNISWLTFQQMTRKQEKRLFKLVDNMRNTPANKRHLKRYTDMRNEAIEIASAIGDNFQDYVDYYSI